jgi:parallel beta-helix repeat protein
LLAAVALVVAGIFVGVVPASADGGHPAGASYVSPHGSAGAAGRNCGTATFWSINAAVAAASAGGTVVVCPGTYAEDVLVPKSLTLLGQNATIDATNLENGIQVVASNVSVSGFTLENANGEGLLVGIDSLADIGLLPESGPVISNVTIDHVKAINDNKGFNGTEASNCKYPGDCGGGIHLQVTEHSTVSNSQTSGNADGILLTDDYGPNGYNVIDGNLVTDNTTECGIVLPSHNGDALSDTGARQPLQGGVFDNVIRNNVVLRNGTALAPPQFGGVGGSGGGVGIFGSFPGTAAYDNVVEGNYLEGNGLAGVVMHAHHPGGEDINGNQIIDNTFATNNVMGDPFDGGVSDFQTTAIAIYSVPTATLTITGNTIRSNAIGIFLTQPVTALGLDNNKYENVGTPVVVQPAN